MHNITMSYGDSTDPVVQRGRALGYHTGDVGSNPVAAQTRVGVMHSDLLCLVHIAAMLENTKYQVSHYNSTQSVHTHTHTYAHAHNSMGMLAA
jgi:hypothetical protein